MATTVERLQLVITADGKQATGEFSKISKAATTEIGKTESGLRKLSNTMSTTTLAASTAAGGAVLAFGTAMADSFAKAGREALKLQRVTGATAEDASRLRVVAQQSGVSIDQLSGAFVKLSKSANTEKGQEALESLGVSLKDANGNALPLTDQLKSIAGGFSRSGDAATKNRAALALFGKSGADLQPLLNKGAKGIDEIIKKADEMGLTLGQDDLDGVKEYTKAQRDLSLAFEGLRMQVGKEIFPAVVGSMKVATGAASDLVGAFGKIPDPVKQAGVAVAGIGASAAVVFGTGGLMLKGIFGAIDAYKELGSRVGDTSMFGRLNGALRNSEGQLNAFGKTAAGIGAVAVSAAVVGAAVEIGNAYNKASQDIDKFNDAMLVLGGGKSGDQTKAFATAINSLTGDLDKVSQQVDSLSKANEGSGLSGNVLTFLNDMFGNDGDLVGTVGEGSAQIALDLNQLDEAVDKLGEGGSVVAMSNALRELGKVKPANDQSGRVIEEQTTRLEGMRKSTIEASAAERDLALAAQKDVETRRAAGLENGEFTATAEDVGEAVKELDLQLRNASAGFSVNQAAAKGWAEGLQQTSGLWNSATDAAQGLGNAWNDVVETGGNLPRAIDLTTAAQGKYTDEQNKAIDNWQALGAAVQTQLGTMLQVGASTDAVRQSAAQYELQLRNQLTTMGITDKAAQDYYITLAGLDGKSVETAITLSGVEAARQKLAILQGDFDTLTEPQRAEIYALIAKDDWTGAFNLYNSFKDKTVTVGISAEIIAGTIGGVVGRLENEFKQDLNGNGVIGRNRGGPIPGVGNGDTVPTMLTPGEFVVTKEAAKRVGMGALYALNAGAGVQRFAAGGAVGSFRQPSFPSVTAPASTAATAASSEPRGPLIGTLNQYGVSAESSPTDVARGALRAAALVES